MDLGITSKRAAVAAASAGLGLATAQALAADGVRVAICGRDQDRLDAAAATLPDDTVALVADVSTAAGATAFVVDATAALGGLDILIPNCGGPPPGDFAGTPMDRYLPAIEANLLASIAMCEAAVPAMIEQGWGRIVAITSATARQPAPNLILSNTARAGLTAFLKTLATEIAPHGVTVNTAQPGMHATARRQSLGAGDLDAEVLARHIPTATIGRAEDFGAVVAFLCSDQARFITGASVPVDGGSTKALQ